MADTPDSTQTDPGIRTDADASNTSVPTTPQSPSQPQAPPTPTPTPAVSAPSQQPDSSVSTVPTPNFVKPAKRGGLAGVVDELADAIAGTQGPGKVYKDADGNEYIEHPTLSRKGQWIKIAGEAVRGAAAGASVAGGPHGAFRGAQAGIEAGDQQADREKQNEQQLSSQVRADNQDRANQIKLKHDQAMWEFELKRANVQATDTDIKFSQEQTDRMTKLVDEGKAFDLGVYKDEADLARIKDIHPEFWKDVYKNDITSVPEIGSDGQRNGIHVYKTTPGIGSEIVTPGTPFKVFTPPVKPGDKPTLQDQIPTVPMTQNQKHAYDLAAYTQMQKWQSDQNEAQLKGSEVKKNLAEANAANARAQKDREKVTGATGYVERPDGTVWIATQGEAEAGKLPFEPMKPGDILKDKQALRQLNDVQMNSSRYTRAATTYADPQRVLTYHGKPVSPDNPVHEQGFASMVGFDPKITTSAELRQRDNTNLNVLMNKAGYAELNASLSGSGGHVTLPVITAFGEQLSRQVATRAYAELSDQAKDLYDGYLRTMSAVPAYIKVLTTIGRSNKEILNLELANIKHPGYAANDILRGQDAFQQNIDRAADGFPRNMVGVRHPSDIRRQIENNNGNPDNLPPDVQRLLTTPMRGQ
jgi:hypothetical protein